MDGSYFDILTVGEIKQQADDQIAGVSRELKEKSAQQRQESLKIVPQKEKMLRANRK